MFRGSERLEQSAFFKLRADGAAGGDHARGVLSAFLSELYQCLTVRGDARYALADAMLYAHGPVWML
jgi:hypothetical protein